MKRNSVLVASVLIMTVFISGCVDQKTGAAVYVCWDGEKVSEPSLCRATTTTTTTTLPKEDKCSRIYESNLTFTEKDRQLLLCYKSKYFEMATLEKNFSICDEIISPDFLGPCYSSVALYMNDPTICDKMEEIEYEARGYYENITSRGVCYKTYASYFKDESVCQKIKNKQMKENCLAVQN